MLFITLEGIDGSGKTTAAKFLKEKLVASGYNVILTREPGGNAIAEKIRNIILDKKNETMDYWTEALLYIAARRQHVVEDILPALQKKIIVISDRFMDSTSAYQGYARGLGIRTLNDIQSTILGSTSPNLTLFFDIEPKLALDRIYKRENKQLDRLESEKLSFYNKVYEGYQILVSENPQRIKVINATVPLNEVLEQVYTIVFQEIDDYNGQQ